MACLPVPKLPLPQLPETISIAPPPIPDLPQVPNLFCCKLPIPPIPPIPIELPTPVISSTFVAALNGYIKTAIDFINSLPAECPLE